MKIIGKLLSSTLVLLAIATTNYASAKDKFLKVGIMSGDGVPVYEAAAAQAKKEFGLNVELVKFDDYVLPNEALDRGLLDINSFQHVPYLDVQTKARNYKLVALANTFVWPIGAYSSKHKSIDSLPVKAKISLPNDPSNQGRALLLLQAQGLIKLKSATAPTQSVADIVENPKKLQISPIDAHLVPRTLSQVDLAVINTNYAKQHNLKLEDAIFTEGRDSPYVNVIVSRVDNQSDPDIKDFIKAFQSKAVWDTAYGIYGIAVVKGWKD